MYIYAYWISSFLYCFFFVYNTDKLMTDAITTMDCLFEKKEVNQFKKLFILAYTHDMFNLV